LSSSPSTGEKKVHQSSQSFKEKKKKKCSLGNGDSFSVWEAVWIPEKQLQSCFVAIVV
jgi:hypothetical protein